MKSGVIFFMLILLVATMGINLTVRPADAGVQGQNTVDAMTERSGEITIHRDPFLDPSWLEKKQEQEERRKAEEKSRRQEERKRQALKLRGIVQVGESFVAIVDGKTLRAGDVIRGRKILEVSRSGIKVLYQGRVRNILWE